MVAPAALFDLANRGLFLLLSTLLDLAEPDELVGAVVDELEGAREMYAQTGVRNLLSAAAQLANRV